MTTSLSTQSGMRVGAPVLDPPAALITLRATQAAPFVWGILLGTVRRWRTRSGRLGQCVVALVQSQHRDRASLGSSFVCHER
jgi:hypothetical protein